MRQATPGLTAALTAREQDKERARGLLAAEHAALADKRAALDHARQAVAAHTQAQATRSELRACTGADLSRLGAESCRLAMRHAELLRAEQTAVQAHATQERRVRSAEAVLATTHAEHAVLDRHHTQLRDQARRHTESQQADEHDDALLSRARSLRAP
jgi:hypothetical protein